ncbi:hypothetical protein [Alkaliphilus hydrothermalis]|uniref:Archaellum component FlaF (FlaF/FlaG flagellin family) n=1 Tax=Alkaliphilus hydrothermalis TaxID=1482730 RepID=A0ABS2NL00_9FIRM|nr:hypothetical protein [Alkaliphilus hydrothermalis]MBM7613601.1 archaellum component FlaF (FlaF/FlaG flagellin family) [Alkaliphilus hydrothermalis]
MDKAIATIVGIVLVLGLIGYAILGQVSGAKDMGDLAAMEQHKVTQMLQNQNIVTGTTVKNYSHAGVTVSITNKGGTSMTLSQVMDGALFEMNKTYNANGELQAVLFTQVDLGR